MSDPILNEVRGMLVFARVLEQGSFSAAARRLGVSRAVVSYQVKQLEERLGVRLLNRSTRRLSLTAPGRQYHESCEKIAREADLAHAFVQSLREEAVGRVAVACPVHLGLQWVVPVVVGYRRRYPGVELDLRFSESVANVIEQGIDLALRAGPLIDSQLQAVSIATIPRHLCASPDYLQAHGWPRTAEDLDGHEWVLYGRPAPVTLSREGIEHRITPSGTLRTDSAGARLQFAIAGQGLVVLPQYDAHAPVQSGQLVELLPNYALPSLELFAVFPQGATSTRATRLLLDMLREHSPARMAGVDS
jgi:DNA-binding transcriptional LysR family regulator